MKRFTRALAVLAGAMLTGCVARTLPAAFPKQKAQSLPEVLASLEQVPARNERPLVAGLTADPQELFVWNLQTGLLWRKPVQATSAPRVAGHLVVTHEGSSLVARDVYNGNPLFYVEEDVEFIGADGVGDLSVIVLVLDPDDTRRGLVIAARAGRVIWELETASPAGTPAIVGDSILVPWGTHRVSVLAAADGTERARLRMLDTVAGHAFVDGGAAYVAQHGWLRVNRALERGTKRDAQYYSPVAREMPGQPGLLPESYEPIPPPHHAGHRVRLDWRVRDATRGAGLEDDTLYLHFYRFVFALDAEHDSVRWLHRRAADVVATAAQPGGIFVLDADGKLAFLDATGRVTWETALGLAPVAAHVSPGTFVPPSASAGAGADAAAAAAMAPLQVQLYEAARLDDPRLAGARAYAVDHLARFDDAGVTGQLLEICDDPGAPETVRSAACRGLGARSVGADVVLAALARRASYLQGVPPPPVGALALAAATMKLRAAVPLLLAHLEDPATRARDLAPLIEALGRLEQRAAVKPIERFLALHHAEPKEEQLLRALSAALVALAKLRGRAAEPDLQRIADDATSMPGLADAARAAIAQSNAPPPAPTPEPVPAAPTPPPAPAPDTRPRYLSMQMVEEVLRPSERKLRACLREYGNERPVARISMVIDGKGVIEGIFVSPNETLACIEPILRAQSFPPTQLGRQQVVHVVRLDARPTRGKQGGRDQRGELRLRPRSASP